VKRSLTFLVVAMLSVLLPLRAVASVSIGLCAAGKEQAAAQAHSDHDHSHEHDAMHHDDGATGGAAPQDCSYCAEHCVGITFVAASMPGDISSGPEADAATYTHHFLPGVVPGQLERPPLAS
jgi:hypothetical protein